MSVSLSFDALAGVVGRLRAAGCVFAEDEARLLVAEAGAPGELADMVDRRVAGMPVEHVVGWAEFCGLRIAVEPKVFVPRRRTEFLVHCAVALLRPRSVVVDLCCGSGALGAALSAAQSSVPSSAQSSVPSAAQGDIELHAADIDPTAVRCARRNVAAFGGRVYQGDLYEPLPVTLQGRVDLLVANVPYVPTGELPLLPAEARLHEARVALDGGGTDGLDVLRRLAGGAPQWLAPEGHLLVETGEHQAGEAAEIMSREGLSPRIVRSGEWDATVILATKPG